MKTTLIALSCAGVLLFAGCSAPAPAPAPAGATTAAATTAPAAPAASTLVPGAEVDRAALSSELEAAAKNLKSMHMDMQTKASMAGQDITFGMTGDMDLSDQSKPKGVLSMTGLLSMDMIMDGSDTVYIKMPMLGEGWFKASHAELGAEVPDATEQAGQYKEFLDKSQKVTYIGEEVVDGEKTRHYTLMVPAKDVAKDQGGDTPVPVELYVNEQGWVKKMNVALTEPAVMSIDLVMSKFNEPVTVQAPADAQPLPKR